jgi:hypothetical protein
MKRPLPEKICTTCGRPFTWRKKWANVWAAVKYCSDRCRMQSKAPADPGPWRLRLTGGRA